MAVILRYSNEFGSFGGQLCKSGFGVMTANPRYICRSGAACFRSFCCAVFYGSGAE